jgi:hypothetical protein
MTQLRAVTDHIWAAESQLPTLGGGVRFDVRTTVIRAPDGGLLVISPIQPGPWHEEVRSLGPVRTVLAPNRLHHLFIPDAARAFPEAEVVGPIGMDAKRPDVSWSRLLDGSSPDALGSHLEVMRLRGVPALSELFVFHPDTGTVVVCDLVFNMAQSRGWLAPLLFRWAGTHQRLAQSRLVRMATRRPADAGASVQHLLQWPFRRVVMAHGTIVEDGPEGTARDRLTAALDWMLKAAPKEAPAAPPGVDQATLG